MRRLAASLAAAALGLVALAGCGEKDEPETTGPVVTAEATTSTATASTTTAKPAESKPTSAPRAAQAFLSSPEAEAVCDDVLTPSFLRRAYGDRAGCLAARRPATLAAPSSMLEVGPSGSAGTRVDAEPRGGVYDGQRLRIIVVQAGDAFLVDSVDSNVPVGP